MKPVSDWRSRRGRPDLLDAARAPRSDVDVDETRDAQHDEEVDWAAPRSDDALRAAAQHVLDDADLDSAPRAFAELEAALAAAPPVPDPTLDVERLARALRRAQYDSYRDDPTLANIDAASIAEEYAALATPAARPTEDDPELAAHAAGWSPDRHGGSEL